MGEPGTATTERWSRIKELFAAALERAPDERAAFVADACAQDPELGREVGELLRAHAVEDGFIESTAADRLGWDAARPAPDWTGRRIGPYRVVAEAGRGGLSRVFRAVREDGEVEQQVAIKLLHGGLDTTVLLARFRTERRILARLSHPHIAHFLDGGATEDGVPYLVMEFVEGEPIDAWCDARGLGLDARLELFRSLCGAVHHVHQNLLVHGDIKGANVLVTRDGVPKLLDFGIAKLLDPATGDTAHAPTLMMMTPEYASPEQLRGEAITTASDVYSLGALLYRLLTGATPFAGGAMPAAAAAVAAARAPHAIVPAPSIAAARAGGAYAAFVPALRAELDAVVSKALNPDPRERYGSAQQLAEDLQRYLRGFPVEARPDSAGYRFAKFARRHAGAVAASGLAVVALVGGVAVASWQAHVAERERVRAERNFEAVRTLSASFLGDVYDAVAQIPGSTAARKLLVDKSLETPAAPDRDAQDSLALKRDLGVAWERLGDVQGAYLDPSLGDTRQALDHYRRSLAIREALVREAPTLPHRLDLLRVQVILGEALQAADLDAEARTVLEAGIRNAEVVAAESSSAVDLRKVAAVYMVYGTAEWTARRFEPGLAWLERARTTFQQIAATAPQDRTARRDVAVVAGRIGLVHMRGTGRYEEGLVHYRQAYDTLDALAREVPGNAEVQRARVYSRASVGQLLVLLRRPAEALRELEPELAQLDAWRRADAADAIAPLALGAVLNLVGEARLQRGEYEAALARFDEAARYLGPELADGVADFRVLRAQMLAGRAQALANLARATRGPERAARLAEARAAARSAIPLLEGLLDDGDYSLEAKRLLADVRPVLDGPAQG